MKLRNLVYNLSLFLTASSIAVLAWSQESSSAQLEDQEIINVENLYKDTKATPPPGRNSSPKVTPTQVVNSGGDSTTIVVPQKSDSKIGDLSVDKITDLSKLAPFSDIVVIQKKFLPKTERFQFYGAAGLTTNSPWFLSLGAKVGLSYNFNERFGLEFSGLFLSNSENKVAKELRDNNSIEPSKFVVMKSNINVDFVWTPLYGKFSTPDDEIVPFDMYLGLGGGTTSTNSQEGSVPNFHLGTGQIFALSKSMAFRWDYSLYFYQATPQQDASASAAATKSNYSDLILTAGVSFFFPEAGYR